MIFKLYLLIWYRSNFKFVGNEKHENNKSKRYDDIIMLLNELNWAFIEFNYIIIGMINNYHKINDFGNANLEIILFIRWHTFLNFFKSLFFKLTGF